MIVATSGYAAFNNKDGLKPFKYNSKCMGDNDVQIQVMYCGICHSDIHQVKDEWGRSNYPMVPGHEITGIVKATGKNVKKFKEGDKVGVGCFVDSCRKCEKCKVEQQEYCKAGVTLTYNAFYQDKEKTPCYGGYGREIVVTEKFVLRIGNNLDLSRAAPLLCAGVTVYSPMMHWNMFQSGKKIGVIGLGGLGHMAVKFCVAKKIECGVISTSTRKKEDALNHFKVQHFILSTDEKQVKKFEEYFDFLIDTVSAPKNIDMYLSMLAQDGLLLTVGLPPSSDPLQIPSSSLVLKRKSIAGSLVGGLDITQKMLDFCNEHKIMSDIELISMNQVNDAYKRVEKSDVKYRFVLDVDKTCPKRDEIKE